ncbi:MAG: TetR/AcrR family transcriptional regulator [Planctomycetota bacterium]
MENASREILNAVRDLLIEGGLKAVTFAEVCKRSGFSRGGLTHHFPTKVELVEALVRQSVDACIASFRDYVQTLPESGSKRSTAYVDFMLKEPAMCSPNGHRDFHAVMIALMHGCGRDPGEQFYQQLAKDLRGVGLSKELTDVLLTTIDGLWMQAAFLPAKEISARARCIRGQLNALIKKELN